MAEDPSLLESSSAEALLAMREKKALPVTPMRRGGLQRVRKPNPRIFGYNNVDIQTTPKNRKIPKLDSTPKSSLKAPDRRVSQMVGNRLQNLLKLPKAHLWVCYEWFYSNIDRALFEGENEFCNCLKDYFPLLKTRTLTRVQWRFIRRLMGKPRRCSSAFFEEERTALAAKRQKIRMLQVKCVDHVDIKDLPCDIPMSLVVGTKVTARLRKPQNGLFTGVIDAIDTANNAYRITFDQPGLGTHSVADIDVLSNESYETLPLSSFNSRKRPQRQMFLTPPRHPSIHSPGLENDPLLGSSPLKGAPMNIDDKTLGGFPIKFLDYVTKVTKLLGVKKRFLKDLKDMNSEAEKMKSYGQPYEVPFQQKYAMLLLDIELLNKKLNEYLKGVTQTWKEVDPEQGITMFDQTSEIRKKCQLEADGIVRKTNCTQDGLQRIKEGTNLKLISNLLSLLLQIRTFADSEMHSFEFKSLQDSLDSIRSQLDSSNIGIFQNNIEVHINHIQNGLTQSGNLQAFVASSNL